MSTVTPTWLNSSNSCMISADSAGSRLPVGSSANRIFRLAHYRAGDAHALLLAAGQGDG